MRYRIWNAVVAVLGILTLAIIVYLSWPSRTWFAVPYGRTVHEVKSLYPILDFQTVTNHGRYIHGDTAAIRRDYPAYDFNDLLWDLDVRYQEVSPGQRFQVEIINRSKFSKRETTITVESEGEGVRVTVKSWYYPDVLLLVPRRDRTYENERLQEIRTRLQQVGPWHC